ncbi:MAG: thioredoxin domain-containing protein, partial [Myxococcales bacterium]|nr:thioredoxin domain-containing protein [Myxococcales bacterium]
SAILLIDYTGTEPTFCSHGGGCQAIKGSDYSTLLGQPIPVYGLGGFLGLYALAIWAESKGHLRSLAVLTGLGALAAVGFIALQIFVIGAICRWCMVVDSAAILAAVVALVVARRGPIVEPTALRLGWSLVPAAVWLLTVLWARHPPSDVEPQPLPEALRPLTVPGRLTIVEITDFECPYCRKLSEKMREVEARYPGKVEVVLVMNPLRIHKGAEPAARGYLCTPAERRHGMAELLFKVREDGLDDEGITTLAGAIGLDAAAFTACLHSEATDQELAYHASLVAATGQDGVPVSYVGRELVLGNRPEEVEDAVQRGLRELGLVDASAAPAEATVPAGWPLWLLFLVEGGLFAGLAALTAVYARRARASYAEGTAP